MVGRLGTRWRAFRDPAAKKARRARRRRAWDEALDEAEARRLRDGPAPTQVYRRSMHPEHRDFS